MNLLEFARGPALEWAMIICVVGIFWRLVGVNLLLRYKDLSKPRATSPAWGGLRTVLSRSWSRHEFHKSTIYATVIGYVWHFGFVVVFFLFVPHIEFIEGVTGLSWPGLPNTIVLWTGVITMVVLILLLIRRLTHPVLRRISNFDDYLSWALTFAPMVTGLMAFGHLGPRYETMLALHILSIDLFLIWFPFGKLMHAILAFQTRAQQGAFFARRGVRA